MMHVYGERHSDEYQWKCHQTRCYFEVDINHLTCNIKKYKEERMLQFNVHWGGGFSLYYFI